MYLKTDQLGHHEIVDGDATDPNVQDRITEQSQISELRNKFFVAANASYLYKKPFKNPLTNQDRAWLYKVAARPTVFFSPDTPTQAADLLKDIDLELEKLHKAKIPII